MPVILFLSLLFNLCYANTAIKLRADLSGTYCKRKMSGEKFVSLQNANGSSFNLIVVPGQKNVFHGRVGVDDPEDARRINNFVHYISLSDLSLGKITRGSIAFDVEPQMGEVEFVKRSAVIYDEAHPKGIGFDKFLNAFEEKDKKAVTGAIELFLSLQDIFVAALDSCRPIPLKDQYSTNSESERILLGRKKTFHLINEFNQGKDTLYIKNEPGLTHGLVDPDYTENIYGYSVNFSFLNPLNFEIQPLSPEYFGKLPEAICKPMLDAAYADFFKKSAAYLPVADKLAQLVKSALPKASAQMGVLIPFEFNSRGFVILTSEHNLKSCIFTTEMPEGKLCFSTSHKSGEPLTGVEILKSRSIEAEEFAHLATHGFCR